MFERVSDIESKLSSVVRVVYLARNPNPMRETKVSRRMDILLPYFLSSSYLPVRVFTNASLNFDIRCQETKM